MLIHDRGRFLTDLQNLLFFPFNWNRLLQDGFVRNTDIRKGGLIVPLMFILFLIWTDSWLRLIRRIDRNHVSDADLMREQTLITWDGLSGNVRDYLSLRLFLKCDSILYSPHIVRVQHFTLDNPGPSFLPLILWSLHMLRRKRFICTLKMLMGIYIKTTTHPKKSTAHI